MAAAGSCTCLCRCWAERCAPSRQQRGLTSEGMQIENMAYPITIEALHTVFSPYGNVQKITIFEKNGLTQVPAPARSCPA